MGSTRNKRGGRPVKAVAPDEVAVLSLRVSGALKSRLDDAAGRAGRNQSQEASRRLEASFQWQPILDLIALIETITDASWQDDPNTFDLVICVVNSFLDCFRPDGPAYEPDEKMRDRHLERLRVWVEEARRHVEATLG